MLRKTPLDSDNIPLLHFPTLSCTPDLSFQALSVGDLAYAIHTVQPLIICSYDNHFPLAQWLLHSQIRSWLGSWACWVMHGPHGLLRHMGQESYYRTPTVTSGYLQFWKQTEILLMRNIFLSSWLTTQVFTWVPHLKATSMAYAHGMSFTFYPGTWMKHKWLLC